MPAAQADRFLGQNSPEKDNIPRSTDGKNQDEK